MSALPDSAFCRVILAYADPVVLIRLVERIQSLNLVPHRLAARWLADDRLAIELILAGLDEPRIETLTGRISQFTTVHSVILERVAQVPMSG
jgi:hypothetical protein